MIRLETKGNGTKCWISGTPKQAIIEAMVTVNAMYVSLAEFGEDVTGAFRDLLTAEVVSGEVFRYHEDEKAASRGANTESGKGGK